MTELITGPKDGDIDRPAPRELRRIWDDAETFYTGGDRRRLHLYENCRHYHESGSNLAKPASVYPVGYEPLCKVCVANWRESDE
jgi:hypothetical protein